MVRKDLSRLLTGPFHTYLTNAPAEARVPWTLIGASAEPAAKCVYYYSFSVLFYASKFNPMTDTVTYEGPSLSLLSRQVVCRAAFLVFSKAYGKSRVHDAWKVQNAAASSHGVCQQSYQSLIRRKKPWGISALKFRTCLRISTRLASTYSAIAHHLLCSNNHVQQRSKTSFKQSHIG